MLRILGRSLVLWANEVFVLSDDVWYVDGQVKHSLDTNCSKQTAINTNMFEDMLTTGRPEVKKLDTPRRSILDREN